MVCVQSQICVFNSFCTSDEILLFSNSFADTVTPVSSTYLNDIPTVAAIAIAMISLVTSVATVAIMVCFVIFLLKRFSAVTKRQNQQYMDKQQTVADATPPATPPSEQDKIYGTEV